MKKGGHNRLIVHTQSHKNQGDIYWVLDIGLSRMSELAVVIFGGKIESLFYQLLIVFIIFGNSL